MVYSSNSMVSFPFSCGNSKCCCLEPVYGITFLQLFEAVTDNINAYYYEAGGWGQPYIINPITTPLAASVVGNLPTLIDALSKPRMYFAARFKTMCLSWIFCATVLHMSDLHIFQALLWDQN
jgi:hypothetical protein